MKKLLSALVLALALCGCSTTPQDEVDTPASLATLDVPTYVTELEKTEPTSIKIDYVYYVETEEGLEEAEVEGRLTADDAAVVTSLATELSSWTLTESEDQSKIYGSATLYIDLNAVIDSNYARVAVYEGDVTKVVVLTNDGFVNYDLSADTPASGLETIILDYFTEAE